MTPQEPLAGPATADEAHCAGSAVCFQAGPVTVTRSRAWKIGLALLALLGVSLAWGRLEPELVREQAEALPAWLVVAVLSVLPLAGFPVSLLHLAAGVRFDFWPALGVVALTGAVHHFLGWALAGLLPRSALARLEPWRGKLKGAGHRDAVLLCCLLPGMPYTVQLYLLPMMGVPLRLLCGLAAALHTVRAVVTIQLGNLTDAITPGRVTALVVYYLVLFFICGWALRRLRRSLAEGREP